MANMDAYLVLGSSVASFMYADFNPSPEWVLPKELKWNEIKWVDVGSGSATN